jgi:hypothetical protein
LTNVEEDFIKQVVELYMPEASVEPGKRRLRVRKFLGFGQNQKEQRPKTTPTTPPTDDASHASTAEILSSTEAKAYVDAVDKLRTILSDTKGVDQFPVESVQLPCTFADIDGVVKSMSSAIADFVETRKKLKQNKSQLRGIVESCYKTSLPFVQGSLNIVTVRAAGP